MSKLTIYFIPNTQRDFRLLNHSIIIYLIFILGWTPIALLHVIDHLHVVSLAVYASLQLLAVLFSLIIIIHMICINKEVREYLTLKLSYFSKE